METAGRRLRRERARQGARGEREEHEGGTGKKGGGKERERVVDTRQRFAARAAGTRARPRGQTAKPKPILNSI